MQCARAGARQIEQHVATVEHDAHAFARHGAEQPLQDPAGAVGGKLLQGIAEAALQDALDWQREGEGGGEPGRRQRAAAPVELQQEADGVDVEHQGQGSEYVDGADLRGAQLEKATLNVRGKLTDMRSANLDGAAIDGSDLTRADLRNASLRGASLGAVWREADLRFSDLSRADFLEADLTGTNLEGANLSDASNLTCDQLKVARNWAAAVRSSDLACGESLPAPTPPAEPPPAEN